jgi:mitogen-activated protein kinase kinase kinase
MVLFAFLQLTNHDNDSALTFRLARRVIEYFETQTSVPVYEPNKVTERSHMSLGTDPSKPKSADPGKRLMNRPEMISWYTKLLDGVKTRYRKVERFAR